MAYRLSRRVKIGTAASVALALAALLAPTVAQAAPKAPSAGAIQQELSKLALKNTMLIEQYDQAQTTVALKQAAARNAERLANLAEQAYTKASLMLGATATAQYETGSFSTAGALLSSDSGQSYLQSLQTLQTMSTHTAQVIAAVSLDKAQADAVSTDARSLLKTANAKLAALAKQKAAVGQQVAKYTSLLMTMSVTQRSAYEQWISPSVSNSQAQTLIANLKSTPATTKAMIAVKFALEQVGKPYVFGTAGPSTYDCSGLTMASWARAGVSLPHSSEDQFDVGTPVAEGALQPGDLLFFYGPPPGHVTIYIGGGLMVSAPEPGEDVQIVPLSDFGSSYVGARRVG